MEYTARGTAVGSTRAEEVVVVDLVVEGGGGRGVLPWVSLLGGWAECGQSECVKFWNCKQMTLKVS